VAIVVALDQSSSMKTADFPADDGTLSRLEAAKRTLARFILGRPDDLIGLVVFANYPDLACRPTLNHGFLLESARSVRLARPRDDGTNLGDAIVWSVQALRTASPKKKVLILLTDGHNEPGVPHPYDPEAAARLARELGVTLHTIAVGQAGGMVRRAEPVTGLDLVAQVGGPDVALLERMARLGGGRPFVATDAQTLEEVFQTINALEKSPVQATKQTRYQEQFAPWVGAALALLLLDRLLAAGRLRRVP
jgi:Ca-activated chloride channel family protein